MTTAINQQPLLHLEFRREILISKLGFTLRRQLCGSQTAVLPPDICFYGIGYTKVSATQGSCMIFPENVRDMYGKCGVLLHCVKGAVCFDI